MKLTAARARQVVDCKILLVVKLLVGSDDELVSMFIGSIQQFPIEEPGPTHLKGGVHCVSCQVPSKGDGGSLVEQDQQELIGFPSELTSWARTASTLQPSTPGNHSRNCPTVAPSLRFSNRADTGTRVSRNTQAPLTLSGSRSIAEHCSQFVIPTPRIGDNPATSSGEKASCWVARVWILR